MSDTPSTPSAFQIERAMSVWHQLRERLDSDPDAVSEEVIAAAFDEAGASRPEELVARLIDAVWWTARQIDDAEQLRKDMIARRTRFERRDDLLRSLIQQLMGAINITRAKGRYARAAITLPTKRHAVITDADKLPDEYVKVTREPKRALIAEHMILDGVIIPGAELSNPGIPVLTIRTL